MCYLRWIKKRGRNSVAITNEVLFLSDRSIGTVMLSVIG